MHKKLLYVLLALVMILSVLPMAAFAEETEHTHDESCGTYSARAITCSHTIQSSSFAEVQMIINSGVVNKSQHKTRTKTNSWCPICNTTATTYTAWVTVYHDQNVKNDHIAHGSEDGEPYDTYDCTCSCGCNYYMIIWHSGARTYY